MPGLLFETVALSLSIDGWLLFRPIRTGPSPNLTLPELLLGICSGDQRRSSCSTEIDVNSKIPPETG